MGQSRDDGRRKRIGGDRDAAGALNRRERPGLPAVPVHVDSAGLQGAVSGPPSAFAEAGLEAGAGRIRAWRKPGT